MNWKYLALIPALSLVITLPAYSNTTNKNHNAGSAVLVSHNSQQGNTTKKANITKKPKTIANHNSVLKIGSKGESVKNAQSALKQQGFYTGTVNGIFDHQTRASVIKFQNSKKLRPDGVIGQQTLAALK